VLASKKHRNTSIHNHLYNTSKRSLVPVEESVEQVKEVIRGKADTIMLKGFNKEFQKAIDKVNLSYSDVISFTEMMLVLEKMRLIKDVSNNSRTINDLLKKLWLEIKSPKEDVASIGMFKSYVAAILNIGTLEPSKNTRITREFAPLYWNRQSNKQQKEATCEYSFKPILCKESLIIAKELKKKGAQSSKNLDKLHKEISKECTFKPKINEYKKLRRVNSINLYQKRGSLNRLGYKIAKDASPKIPFTVEELEHPKVKRTKSQQNYMKKIRDTSDSELSYRVKDIIRQKSVTDIIDKKETLKKSEFSQLNIRTENGNEDSLSDKKEKEILLYIYVNLKGSKQRIVVYKGDTAQQITEQFALQNSTINL